MAKHLTELGSPIEWQRCIEQALAEHGLEDLPADILTFRYFIADALRRNLEQTFGLVKVATVVDALLADLGTAPRERKMTIDRAHNVRRLSAMITLPPTTKKAGGAVVEALRVPEVDLETIRKLVPNIQVRTYDSNIGVMNAARDAGGGRQVFLIDARAGMKPSSLRTLLSVLGVGQTIVWVDNPEKLELDKNDKRIVCDASVTAEEIAVLLRIAFFSRG